MNNSELLELTIASLPYPEQIKNIDFTIEPDAIRFNWRSSKYPVSSNLSVDVIENGCLVGSDITIVIGSLLKKTKLLRSL